MASYHGDQTESERRPRASDNLSQILCQARSCADRASHTQDITLSPAPGTRCQPPVPTSSCCPPLCLTLPTCEMGGGGHGRLRLGSRARSAAKVAKISLRDTALPFAAAGGGEGRRTRQLCPGKLSTRGSCQAKYTSGRDPRGHGGDKGDLPAAGPPRLAAARDLASASRVWSPPRWPCPHAVLSPQGRNPGGGGKGMEIAPKVLVLLGTGTERATQQGARDSGCWRPFSWGWVCGSCRTSAASFSPPKTPLRSPRAAAGPPVPPSGSGTRPRRHPRCPAPRVAPGHGAGSWERGKVGKGPKMNEKC